MSEKSQWGSKLGFILASAGSAIGLGAVWKFPYMTATNGGGGFLLVFLISTLLIGFPLLLAEFALGRSAGVSAIKSTTLLVGLVPSPFSSFSHFIVSLEVGFWYTLVSRLGDYST